MLADNKLYRGEAEQRLLNGWRDKGAAWGKLVAQGQCTFKVAKDCMDGEIKATQAYAKQIATALRTEGGKAVMELMENLSVGVAGLGQDNAESVVAKTKIIREMSDFVVMADMTDAQIRKFAFSAMLNTGEKPKGTET